MFVFSLYSWTFHVLLLVWGSTDQFPLLDDASLQLASSCSWLTIAQRQQTGISADCSGVDGARPFGDKSQ
jgi:hypothetical protein